MIYTSIHEYDSNNDEIFDLDTDIYCTHNKYTDECTLGCKDDHLTGNECNDEENSK